MEPDGKRLPTSQIFLEHWEWAEQGSGLGSRQLQALPGPHACEPLPELQGSEQLKEVTSPSPWSVHRLPPALQIWDMSAPLIM